ncbi:peptidase S8/S53 domain-containing protein [Fusarium redolens]|uniref:Peptidase S8/S53 domain-containing protein n=1 Tax=Fusarium redolens TaxID=48865 RepID=A0A9P9KE26_FUSRE|nr:peptidase S8/S53 domain-containing protein [Fusarium redolens]KAH7259122.1 peptidase S8/S53 domain-containing protein [Fusarium redolens]
MKFTLFQFIGLALVSSAAATPVENNELAVRDTILEPNSDSSIIKDRAVSGSANYLIYPKTNAAKRDIDAFTKSLQSQAGKAKVDTLTDVNGQLLAWYATLSANQVAAINKNSVIGSIAPDAPLKTKAKSSGVVKRALQTDKRAQPELQMFSTAPGKRPAGYTYDEKAGQGVTIYVLDEGFNLRHREFTASPGRKRWIFSKGASGENDPDGHGSCCASKALGNTVGVAPKADLVAVKLQLTSWSLLKAWQAVVLDVQQNRLQGKAVVSNSKASIAWSVDRNERWFRDVLETLLKNLEALDVVVVSSSGNFGTLVDEVNTYPSLFADRTPIIVTGAVDNNGRLAPFSQGGPLVTTTAPGVAVKCAAMSGTSAYQAGEESTGTSFSTPAVAGLAAYFLSLDSLRPRLQVRGSVARNVKALIQEHHYARVSGGPKVAWNAHTLLRN